MNYNIIPTERFKKEAKRLIKKYVSIKQELSLFSDLLSINPYQGIHLGNNIFKIRIAIKSKQKGKSGGARIISYIIKENKEVYLLTIYDKAEFDAIDDKTLKKIIANLNAQE